VRTIAHTTIPTEKEHTMSKADERSDYVPISARIPADLAAGLEASAKREDRTVSAELRRAIRHYLTIPVTDQRAA
jgi:hypothetical protein